MVRLVDDPPEPLVTPPRPPVGLQPKELHDTIRALEILDAIERYAKAGMLIPAEWIVELKELYPWRRNL